MTAVTCMHDIFKKNLKRQRKEKKITNFLFFPFNNFCKTYTYDEDSPYKNVLLCIPNHTLQTCKYLEYLLFSLKFCFVSLLLEYSCMKRSFL